MFLEELSLTYLPSLRVRLRTHLVVKTEVKMARDADGWVNQHTDRKPQMLICIISAPVKGTDYTSRGRMAFWVFLQRLCQQDVALLLLL